MAGVSPNLAKRTGRSVNLPNRWPISALYKAALVFPHGGEPRSPPSTGTDLIGEPIPRRIPQPKWGDVKPGKKSGRGRLRIRGNIRRGEMMPIGPSVALGWQQVFPTDVDPFMITRHNKPLLHSRNNRLLPPGPYSSRSNFFRQNWSNVPF